jgi:hypothetical protein
MIVHGIIGYGYELDDANIGIFVIQSGLLVTLKKP